MIGEYWELLEEDEEQLTYNVLSEYRDNHLSNGMLMVYDLKVDRKISNTTKEWVYEDKEALNALIANLIACINKDRKLVYPRRKATKLISKKNLTVRRVIKAVDWLSNNGYAINSIGNPSDDPSKRISSHLTPTQKFKELWTEEIKLKSQLQYVDQLGTIELRDGDKVVVLWRSDSSMRHLSNLVRELNVMNERHEIRDRNGDLMTNIYCRIFNETFEQGGRYYRADVLGLQHNKGKQGRYHMTIDGSNVVEVDLCNLHFRIAADLNGIDVEDLPLDVYSGIIPDEDNLTDRRVVKIAVNMMLNSVSTEKARGAIQRFINKLSSEEKEVYTLGTATEVMQLILSAYPEFDEILCKSDSYGRILQNHDSGLATDIVEIFLKKEIPILIVHDSFITKVEYTNLLCDTIGDCYRKRFDSCLPVPVSLAWKEDGVIIERKMNV